VISILLRHGKPMARLDDRGVRGCLLRKEVLEHFDAQPAYPARA
jgi:hypothetical protein